MGIKGLLTFLLSQKDFWFDIKELHSSTPHGASISKSKQLIIDGNNVAYELYKFDSLCGGQFMSYYEEVIEFYTAVINSGFTPIVVLHGIIIQEKQATLFSRAEYSMREYKGAIMTQAPINKLPRMGMVVYEQALKYLNIEIISCDCEEDQVIAALSVSLNAPVLTSDSDFYVMDLPGIITIRNIDFISGKLVGKYFNFKHFIQVVKLNYCMIPLAVVLLTNDFTPTELRIYLDRIMKGLIRRYNSGTPTQKLLKGLSEYTTPDPLIAHIKTHIPFSRRKLFDDYYKSTQQQYMSPASLIKINLSEPYYGLKYNTIMACSHFALEHLIDIAWTWKIIINEFSINRSETEDYSRIQACICSNYIRSCLYSIILKKKQYMLEIMRTNDLKLTEKVIHLPVKLTNNADIPKLDVVCELDETIRYKIFYQILVNSIDAPLLSITNSEWRIIACMLVYWANNCTPKPDFNLLRLVLLACFISYIESRGVFSKYIPTDLKKRLKYNIEIAHQLAQWQSVFSDTIRLLLVLKLPIVKPHLFYNGEILFSLILSADCQIICNEHLLTKERRVYIDSIFSMIGNQLGITIS